MMYPAEMTRPPVSEFLTEEGLQKAKDEQAADRERDRALLALINVGLAIEHAKLGLTWPATMVLLFIVMAPDASAAQIAKWLRMTPGGVAKIIDQLSIGRMVRGERQTGLGLVERSGHGNVIATPKGEALVRQLAKTVITTVQPKPPDP